MPTFKTTNKLRKYAESEFLHRVRNGKETYCPICNRTIDYGTQYDIGHIIAAATGGTTKKNLVLVHSACNKETGQLPIGITYGEAYSRFLYL